ncbi:S8 family serine peptidase [Pseudosporangium ferrugineum]|uniref:Subtilase family protein n=1 Tax=Pseudosporangium ferrugineum TaxID=439699 RepID=A0A2T0RS99_9ACTN|nr:S8 family serine peptidase [Pseudosporangium ferrugineum]PRY23997.1 subtilase family protein [Pseudosporangium ferrugineum]
MRVFTRRHLAAAIAGCAVVFGMGSPAAAADGSAEDTYATVLDPAGRPTFVEVTAPTLAQEVRRAENLPGSIGASFATEAGVAGAPSDDTWRGSLWGNDALHIDDVTPRPGTTGQLVAVLDTGVSPAEEDWTPGQVRCDLGADVIGDAYTTSSGGTGCVDPHGHGTHVAGTIGAVAGNGKGVAGIASGVGIIPVRVLNASGTGSDIGIAQGIVAAVDHGATVINMSLSGPQTPNYNTAIAYATSHGVSVVAANGNNRQTGNQAVWPASVPGVIAVAATTAQGTSAYFSNSSGTATVAAPGYGILSMDARHTDPSFPYVSMSGTSMASPHVAATVALWRAGHASATAAQVRDALIGTAIDAGPAGFDNEFGYGTVNPYRLLTGVEWPAVPADPAPADPAPVVTTPAPSPVVTTPAPSPVVTTPTPSPVVTTPPAGPEPAPPSLPVPAPVITPPPAVAPAAPSSVRVTAQVEALRVSWAAVPGGGTAPVSGYRLYRDGVLRATLAGTALTDRVDGGIAHTYAVEAYGPGGTSARISATGTARWAAARLALNRTAVARKGRIVVRGTSLRPGSVLTVRETYAYRKTTRTVALVTVRLTGGDVSVSVLPVQSARTGTLTVQGVGRDGRVVRITRSIRVG